MKCTAAAQQTYEEKWVRPRIKAGHTLNLINGVLTGLKLGRYQLLLFPLRPAERRLDKVGGGGGVCLHMYSNLGQVNH